MPAVAGLFYPGDGERLLTTVKELLAEEAVPVVDVEPSIVIVPHAGYIYSGPVAAVAYRLLAARPVLPARVVLMGPAHRSHFAGVASAGASGFQTPLGLVPADEYVASETITHRKAHASEHSLEVQLPFLQAILSDFSVSALLTGRVRYETAADILEDWLDTTGGLVVISSDLSHYLDYESARARDHRAATAITELRPEDLEWNDACGLTAIQAALMVARRRGWHCRLVDLRNSGDTAGDRSRVVGYGAFAIGPLR